MNLLLVAGVFFYVSSLFAVNLLPGDSSVETSDRAMTYGTWGTLAEKLGSPSAQNWTWDNTCAYDGKKSVKCRNGEFSSDEIFLEKGSYIYSFYAKSEENDTKGFLNVHPWKRTTFSSRIAGRKKISFTKEWRRYSYSFTVDVPQTYTPCYGVYEKGKKVWFDCFQLEKGSIPTEWKNAQSVNVGLQLPREEGNVFLRGTSLPLSVNVYFHRNKVQNVSLAVTVRDWLGREVFRSLEKLISPKMDFLTFSYQLPSEKRGWFRVSAKIMKDDQILALEEQSYVVVAPPVKLARGMEPFSGMSAQPVFPEAYRKIGVRWLESHIFWNHAEIKKGVYDYDYLHHFSVFKKLKEMGFYNKACFTLNCPDRLQSKEIKDAAPRYSMSLHRFLPPENCMDQWRAFVRDFLEKNQQYCDSFEIGWELDAQLGINPYYKERASKILAGKYAAGNITKQAGKFISSAAEEIRKIRPDAKIAATRPSDSDTHSKYIFSEEIFKECGHLLNTFGVDCYPRPRWIGPNTPPTGSEQDLQTYYQNALDVMKRRCKGEKIYISEYGYFIDYKHRHTAEFQMEQANRLARSFLFAKACGFQSLHYYTGQYWSNLLENNRYTMSIWERGLPFRAVAAYSAASEIVENVVESRMIRLSDRFAVVVFRKVNGDAVAALWSLAANYTPFIEIQGKSFTVCDMMGEAFVPNEKNGFYSIKLSECPVYFWSRGTHAFETLFHAMESLRVIEDLPAEISVRFAEINRLKLYILNRSLRKNHTGTIVLDGKERGFSLPAGGTSVVSLPWNSRIENVASIRFEGYRETLLKIPVPELIGVPKNGIAVDQSRTLRLNTMDRIMPVDVFGWSGPEDLSGIVRLSYHDDFLFCHVDVTDDRHFNHFEREKIWRGDSIQLAIDPLTNHIGRKSGLDPDDTKLTLALAKGKPSLVVHEGPFKERLQAESEFFVDRDEARHLTRYRISLPLKYLGTDWKKGRIIGFNLAILDDDSGKGMDYWMFLKTGLVEDNHPEEYQQIVFE